jgi:hypothetical protein
MTKLDDLREFGRSQSKKKDDSSKKDLAEKERFSLEVAGSESITKPLASFGDSETDPDILDRLYMSPRHKPNMGEGSSYWDQD